MGRETRIEQIRSGRRRQSVTTRPGWSPWCGSF